MQAVRDVIMGILPLREKRWIDSSKILELADELRLDDDIEAKIYFLRELTAIVRRLPMKIYGDPEDRIRLLDALQQALDTEIETEEELLAAEALDAGPETEKRT